MQVQTHGREGKGGGDSGDCCPLLSRFAPDICIHELTKGFSDKHTFFLIVNLENLTLATHI